MKNKRLGLRLVVLTADIGLIMADGVADEGGCPKFHLEWGEAGTADADMVADNTREGVSPLWVFGAMCWCLAVWRYKLGIHKLSKPAAQRYKDLVQFFTYQKLEKW